MAAQRGSRPGMPAAVAPPAPVHPKLADFGITPLAKGGMGNVFKAVRRADNRIFALKQVNLNKMSTVDRQTAIDEARVLAQLNHPHVIKYYDSFIDSEKNLNILMEYAAGGDLANILRRSPGKPLPEEFLWKLFIQTLIGLAHIHGKRIIHRDIKALNIFFDSKGNVKIGDMGVARPLSADSNMANSKVGTIFYLSPELCNDKPYSFKSDIWALGVVMYECMMGRYPFDAQNTGAALRKIIDGRMQPLSGPYTPQLLSIVKECLTYKPEARPDATALLRHATLLSKAKALGVSLNPQPSKEDVPMYEQVQPQQQQQMPQYGGSPGPGPSPHGQYAYQPQQQGGYSPGRPMSAGARPGASPYQQQSPQQQNGYAPPYGSPYGAGQAPPDHPFALAGASPGGAGAGPASPGAYIGAYAAQGPGAPPHQYPYQQPQQQQQQHRPGGYGSPQQQAPPDRGNYTPQGNRNPHDPWDNLAADIHKVHISDTERARNNQDRIQVNWETV